MSIDMAGLVALGLLGIGLQNAGSMPQKHWKLLVGGDIMLNGVPARTQIFDSILGVKSDDSVFYANLEVPLTNSKQRTSGKSAKELKARTQFILKADPRHILEIKKLHLDVVSLGNNHTMDYGPKGLKEEAGLLSRSKIAICGAGINSKLASSPAIIRTKTGVRVAFFSTLSFLNPAAMAKCTPAKSHSAGVSALTLLGLSKKEALKMLTSIVKAARKRSDVVVICPHWGTERQPIPRDYQVNLGRLWIDAGADAVIGNHPHVLQPGEVYRGKPIIYSLGNLVGPTQGSSGLYSLTFNGSIFVEPSFIPLQYSRGVVKFYKPQIKNLLRAELTLQRKFPHRLSTILLGEHK